MIGRLFDTVAYLMFQQPGGAFPVMAGYILMAALVAIVLGMKGGSDGQRQGGGWFIFVVGVVFVFYAMGVFG